MTRITPALGRAALLACLLAAGAGSARAADEASSPYVTPQADVDVTYTIYPPHDTSQTMSQRMRWSASRMMQRVQGSWLRTGVSKVAGLPCALWQTQDTDQRSSEICYTDDGVMLEVIRDGKVMVEATSVNHATQDASVFETPSGLKELRAAHP